MISIKTTEELKIMREGGAVLKSILDTLEKKVYSGVTPIEIDQMAHDLIVEAGFKPAFLGLYGFPNTTCISVNDEVVHGVPSNYKLKYGDLISIDIGLIHNNLYLDMASTVPVLDGESYDKWAETDQSGARLVEVTRESLEKAISLCKPGVHLGDVGHAIQKMVEDEGFGVARELAGHGIGKKLHEDPLVLNFGQSGTGTILREGMTIAIEPIITEGKPSMKMKNDGFTYITKDGKRAAHFEHTVAITKDGCVILTG